VSTFNQDRWQQISPHLDTVLSLPEEERTAWLATFRREKPELADLLEELLMEQAIVDKEAFLAGQPNTPFETSQVGQTVGAYRLISPIGEGGMGTVWLAERCDGRFERKVAIKFLRYSLGSLTGAERFKREGRILGQLSHPHIAELIDAGVSTTGQPYIVLEHIDGKPIDAYCDTHRLDVSARIVLFLDVLSAVSRAHVSLVVHRDIKPSNVLVRNDGQVKLLDFGIAKLLAEDGNPAATHLTLEGGVGLTPLFAAPEQITAGAITTMTDVYALGALLYLLLTGQHPSIAESSSPAQLVKAIVEKEPARPSDACVSGEATKVADRRATTPERLRRQLEGDLDLIIGKALKKYPTERYSSAIALADDLQRFLDHEPIRARPDSFLYNAAKFVRRNRTAVGFSAVAACAVLAGAIGILIQTRTARIQRDFAFRQLARAEADNELMSFVLSDAAPSGKPFKVNDLLDRAEQIVQHQPPGDPINRSELLIGIGRLYANEDAAAKSLRVLEEAYQTSRSLADPLIRAEAGCDLADAQARGGDTQKAEALFQEALHELPQGPEFALQRGDCLLLGGEVARERGDANTAISRVLEAQQVVQNSFLQSKPLDVTIAIDKATTYRVAGRNLEAIAAFKEAAALMKELGRENTRDAVELFNSWAYTEAQLGHPMTAETLYARAISISRDSESEAAVSPMVLNNYAKTLHVLGRLNEAASYSEQACSKAKQTGFDIAVNQSLLERARIYRDQGDIARSDAMLAEVEPRLQRSLPPGHYAFAALDVEKAHNAFDRGDLKTSLTLANEALAIDEGSIKSGGQGSDALPSILYTRAAIEIKAGNPDRAVTDATRAVTLLQEDAEPGSFSTQLARSYMALGLALESEGKHEDARNAFRSAAEHFQGTVGPENSDTRNARHLAELATQ
jgi:serine/threonine protein kinase/Flp pilus assembly protein TadD